MSLVGWQDLVCTCGNLHFHQAFTLGWHEQHGTTARPDGWVCTGCGLRSNNAKMISIIKERNLQTKIKELQDQL